MLAAIGQLCPSNESACTLHHMRKAMHVIVHQMWWDVEAVSCMADVCKADVLVVVA